MVKEYTSRGQPDILTPALWGCPESRSSRPSSSCPLGAHSRSQGWRTEMGLPEEGHRNPGWLSPCGGTAPRWGPCPSSLFPDTVRPLS